MPARLITGNTLAILIPLCRLCSETEIAVARIAATFVQLTKYIEHRVHPSMVSRHSQHTTKPHEIIERYAMQHSQEE